MLFKRNNNSASRPPAEPTFHTISSVQNEKCAHLQDIPLTTLFKTIELHHPKIRQILFLYISNMLSRNED
jgi:hypothetical protein